MKKLLCLGLSIIFAVLFTACGELDTSSYGQTAQESNTDNEPIEIPVIKSEDAVMPNYIDISLYDEENYADVYLGEDFEYDVTYCGEAFAVPSSYETMTQSGWQLVESDGYNKDTQILTGKSLTVDFVNENGKKITAVFKNDFTASESLENCKLVRFIIKENVLIKTDSQYGSFRVNGVGNNSALTDLIEALGTPSHFHCQSGNDYYLDWFITEDDRRSCITVYVDTAEDEVDAIEFSYY